jgi:hypothetical protein
VNTPEYPTPNVDLGALQADQSLAGLSLTEALDRLGITQAFMQDARFERRGAQVGLSEWALAQLLTAGKTMNGRNLPITLRKVENTIATKRYEGRIEAGLPRRAPEYAETKRKRAIYRKRMAALAKARQALARKRLAEQTVDAVAQRARQAKALDAVDPKFGTFTQKPATTPPPVTLQDVYQLATLLVDKIKLLDQKLVGALR